LFPALNHNPGSHKFKGDSEMKMLMIRRLMTQDIVLCQQPI